MIIGLYSPHQHSKRGSALAAGVRGGDVVIRPPNSQTLHRRGHLDEKTVVVAAAQQSSAEQISGVDRKLSALQEALPAKFREIVEAVRQSMEARVTLELTELENRVSSRGVAPEQLRELQRNLRGE